MILIEELQIVKIEKFQDRGLENWLKVINVVSTIILLICINKEQYFKIT